jgi:hypothetical protein
LSLTVQASGPVAARTAAPPRAEDVGRVVFGSERGHSDNARPARAGALAAVTHPRPARCLFLSSATAAITRRHPAHVERYRLHCTAAMLGDRRVHGLHLRRLVRVGSSSSRTSASRCCDHRALSRSRGDGFCRSCWPELKHNSAAWVHRDLPNARRST